MNKIFLPITIILLTFFLSACQNGKKEGNDDEDEDELLTPAQALLEDEDDEEDRDEEIAEAEVLSEAEQLDRAEDAFAKRDYRTAVSLLLPLAQAGNPDAQYALGYALYEGLGTPQDRMQAYFWIQESARQGNTSALMALEIFEIDPNLPLDH